MPRIAETPSASKWNTDNIFAGTAWYYARYRPAYPNEVISLLRSSFNLTKKSCVLDLGCGTGQVALPMAPYVSQIIALDPQQAMLEEGRQAAKSKDITNITWLKGESGKLPSMAKKIGDINLTTIARAFHWMDREKTLIDLFGITLPGGGVAVISDNGPADGEMLPWKEAIRLTVKKWLGSERKAGTEGIYTHPEKPFETYLRNSQFCNFQSANFQLERAWSLDEIIGYLYSTSLASLPVLGDKKEPFEADLRKRLPEIQPDRRFVEPVNVNVMMVWKNKRSEKRRKP
jgi:ubiquinone/menaquinone biosynthesis C-methylase UbiE